MKRMKYILAVFILGCYVTFTACGTEEDSVKQEQSSRNRSELTEEEIKGGHVSFQMAENLVVDADVTAKEKYEKGLSSYYLKIFCETDKESEKKFLKTPTLSLHSFEEWKVMLNKIVPGKFQDDKFKINKSDADIRQAYKGENGTAYSFQVDWSNYKRGVAEKTGFNSPVIYVKTKESNNLSNRAINVRTYVQNYNGSGKADLPKDAEEKADRMKEFLQEITGRTVYEEYDCVVVNKESIDLLNQVQSWVEAEEPEEDYAALYFYYDIDGLPFKELTLDYFIENDDTADELCYWSSMPGKRLKAISEHAQELVINRDGIISLECSNLRYPGEVYKEKLPVVSPNEALKQVKEFYERQLMTEKCVVTDIELLYTGYFSDGADGEIQPVIAPFWEVKVYDNREGIYKHFTYDAYTGECIREGAQQ